MITYTTAEEVQKGFRTLDADELDKCGALIEEAALIIDRFAPEASEDVKNLVSCRMVRRAIGDGDTAAFPMGTTQGSMSALGYSQTWTMGSSGSSGELYLSKLEKELLGIGNKIGSHSPVEDLVQND